MDVFGSPLLLNGLLQPLQHVLGAQCPIDSQHMTLPCVFPTDVYNRLITMICRAQDPYLLLYRISLAFHVWPSSASIATSRPTVGLDADIQMWISVGFMPG